MAGAPLDEVFAEWAGEAGVPENVDRGSHVPNVTQFPALWSGDGRPLDGHHAQL